MASINSYKCPNCSASIEFDAASGKTKCKYCGTSFEIDKLEEFNAEQNLEADVCNWQSVQKENITLNDSVSYVCPACGGEVVGDGTTSATSCPYCGTPIVLNDQLSDMLKPDLIVPFSLTKEDAKKAYGQFLKGKKLLPNDFKINNIIDKINGIYVPYWLFDADVNGKARFRTTRTRIHREGDNEITETSHYLVYRDGNASFEMVPVDALSKLPDALLDSLEPFDYSKATEFNPAYLASYLSDRYDKDEEESITKANERIRNSMIQLLADTVVGYDSCALDNASVHFDNGIARYALLPVYIFSTKYQGKIYNFAMNGQTGKFAGDLPMDKGKAITYTLLSFLITFVIVFLLMFMNKGGF